MENTSEALETERQLLKFTRNETTTILDEGNLDKERSGKAETTRGKDKHGEQILKARLTRQMAKYCGKIFEKCKLEQQASLGSIKQELWNNPSSVVQID